MREVSNQDEHWIVSLFKLGFAPWGFLYGVHWESRPDRENFKILGICLVVPFYFFTNQALERQRDTENFKTWCKKIFYQPYSLFGLFMVCGYFFGDLLRDSINEEMVKKLFGIWVIGLSITWTIDNYCASRPTGGLHLD